MQGTIKILSSIGIFCLCLGQYAFAQNCPGFAIVGSPNTTGVTCVGDTDGSVSILLNYNAGNMLGSFIDGVTVLAPMQDTIVGGGTLATATYDNLPAGTYDLIVADISPCADTFPFTIQEPTAPFTVVIDTSSDANCGNNGYIHVITDGGWSSPTVFTWDGVDGNNNPVPGFPRNLGPTLSAIGEGTYTVTATDNRGCMESDQVTISGNIPFSIELNILDGSLPLELGDSIDLVVTPNAPSPTITYTWFPTTNLTSISAVGDTVRVKPCKETSYLVYAIDPVRQCDALDSITITLQGEFNPWLPNIFNPDSFNPANNKFKAFGVGIETVEMEIFDRKGALIYQNPDGVIIGEWDGTLGDSGTQAVTGKYLYVLRIRSICGEIVTRSGGISLLR